MGAAVFDLAERPLGYGMALKPSRHKGKTARGEHTSPDDNRQVWWLCRVFELIEMMKNFCF